MFPIKGRPLGLGGNGAAIFTVHTCLSKSSPKKASTTSTYGLDIPRRWRINLESSKTGWSIFQLYTVVGHNADHLISKFTPKIKMGKCSISIVRIPIQIDVRPECINRSKSAVMRWPRKGELHRVTFQCHSLSSPNNPYLSLRILIVHTTNSTSWRVRYKRAIIRITIRDIFALYVKNHRSLFLLH